MWKKGLFGYNSVLTGLALFLFLDGSQKWVFAIAGAALAVFVTAAVMHVLKAAKVPVLTLPFNLLAWTVLLASFSLSSINLAPHLVQQTLSDWSIESEGAIELTAWLKGVGQVYFHGNNWSSAVIIIGIFFAGWRYGVYTLTAAVLSWSFAYSMGADVHTLNEGLYEYNAILTMLAVSVVFSEKRVYSVVTGIVAVILSVIVTASITDLLIPYGLPALTMPFVVVTWLVLAMRNVLVKM